ncbi:MAG TPA: 2OG-Fe(II) oxygenase [Gammaproteobacteria bacterium]|nr:2OG-Fe(II) oxygenase [Gammaproteobacteria bacterium]
MSQLTSEASREPSPDVAKAEQCDAAGQHTEAINHLVAGVRKNDVEAITRLGKRLLVGDRAPLRPNDAIGLLADASERGGAEAAARLAVLFGIGVSRRHDLADALECLVVAAERGWPAAQAQLAVLAGERAGGRERTAEGEKTGGGDRVGAGAKAGVGAEAGAGVGGTRGAWRSLAASIDLSAWLAPPPGTELSDSPLIRSFPNFLSAAVCRWLIERARPLLSRALVYEGVTKTTLAHPTRTNNAAMFNLLDTDFICVLMERRICRCLGVPFGHLEPPAVLHYAEGREITEHFDFVDPNVPDYDQEIARRGQRIVTFLVYLNDDYAGGETEFPRLDISHKGRAGEGLFFVNALADGKSDLRTLHAGRPPRQGEKWIVSQFVRNRPVLQLGAAH